MAVELNRDILVDLAGWAVLKEARGLLEANRVKSYTWDDKLLSGEVAGVGASFFPRLNLRSTVFAENRCNCPQGRRGNVCAHAIALCLASIEQLDLNDSDKGASQDTMNDSLEVGPETTGEIQNAEEPKIEILKSLVLSKERGIPGRLLVLLPPNLATSAPKDKIAVRVDFQSAAGKASLLQQMDRGRAYHLQEWDLKLGGYIESICGGKLHSMLQLTRKQLQDILRLIEGNGYVAWIKKADTSLQWEDNQITGVHEHLIPPKTIEKNGKDVASNQNAAGESEKPKHGRDYRKPAAQPSSNLSSRKGTDFVSKKRVTVDGSPHYLSVELPSRSDPSYFEILELLKQWRFRLEPSNGKWWLRDGHHVMNFLADHWDQFRQQYGAVFSKNFSSRMGHLEEAKLEVNLSEARNEFELELKISGDVSTHQMREQLAKGRRFIKADSGKVILVNQKKISELEALSSKLTNRKGAGVSGAGLVLNGNASDLCDWETLLEENAISWQAPEQWQQKSQAIRNLSKLSEAPVASHLNSKLRLYQKIGVAWMYHLFTNELGGILADEMGLGKTVQAIALITAIKATHPAPVLVVGPAGLVENWAREIRKFAPEFRVYSHHGAQRMKDSGTWEKGFDVVITSYSTLSRDLDIFQQSDWTLIIGDEAQHIKNRKTRHAKSLKGVQAKGRFLLTGTPIENSLQDLYSLFEFLMPGYLKAAPSGTSKPEDRLWYQDRIRERASHYLLRRTKKQVAPELPEKLEQVIYCEMMDAQKKLYEKVRSKSYQSLEKLEQSGASKGALKMAAFTELLRLRQVCADPRIIDESLRAEHSAKLIAFRELIQESIDGGHRVLVFSQFVSLLTLLKDDLQSTDTPFCYIDGSTKNRMREVDRFNEDESIPVFLISLKAGGTGLNLTGADTVIHFDPWWNPAVEAQATDRAHRIGQTRKVTSIRMIVSGTVEEKVEQMKASKQKLLDALFEESEMSIGKLELSDMKQLLES